MTCIPRMANKKNNRNSKKSAMLNYSWTCESLFRSSSLNLRYTRPNTSFKICKPF